MESYQELSRTTSIMVISYKTPYKITWMMLSSKCQTQASCSPYECIMSPKPLFENEGMREACDNEMISIFSRNQN